MDNRPWPYSRGTAPASSLWCHQNDQRQRVCAHYCQWGHKVSPRCAINLPAHWGWWYVWSQFFLIIFKAVYFYNFYFPFLQGVMVARGLLANPAMFAGNEDTPLKCIWDWVDISIEEGTPFTCFHRHLIYMLERVSSQPERKVFNSLSSTSAVIDYLQNTYGPVHDLEPWICIKLLLALLL